MAAGFVLIAGSAVIYASQHEPYRKKAELLPFPITELGGCKSFDECKTYCNRDENIPKCVRFSIKNKLITETQAREGEKLLELMDKSGIPGKCGNAPECFVYCESVASTEECLDYALRHGLVSAGTQAEEIRRIAEVHKAGVRFPGGCKTQRECETYCEDTANLGECLNFAEKNGLRSTEEIAEGRKVAKALNEGASLPGGCRTKAACEAYCESPSNMRQCVDFAKKAGFMSEDEVKEAEKIIPLLERGEKTPGGCKRKEECEAYCYDPANLDECLDFAGKAGILSLEELADAKKVAPFIKSGETPGGCRRKEECEKFCSDPGNFEACVVFAEKAGFMSKEDAELARKTKGVGPGGCKSKTECEAFCKDPANQEGCMNFAKEHGLEGAAGEMQKEAMAKFEGEVRACLEKSTCKEVLECFQGMAKEEGGEGGGALPPEAKAKLDACIAETVKEFQQKGGGGEGRPPGFEGQAPPPGEGQAPPLLPSGAPEDVKQQYQEEYQRQYQQEYQRQQEEASRQYCGSFEAAPSCDYVGPAGSDNYNLCKKCFPDK